MTLRKLALAATTALALPGAAGVAQADDKTLRVGMITDMSGQYSGGNGPGSVIAAQMAADEIGGTVAGRQKAFLSMAPM